MNVYKTYVRSTYVLLPRECKHKTFAIEKILLKNNLFNVDNKYIKRKREISPNLTVKVT